MAYEMDKGWHDRDLFYLREFNADTDNEKLQRTYDKFRSCWTRSGRKGELPQATILAMAVQYQKSATVEPTNNKPKLKAVTA